MNRLKLIGTLLAATLVTASGQALAEDRTRDRDITRDQTQDRDDRSEQKRDRDQDRVQDQQRIFGSQLMTEQERNEHRLRMRAARTAEEREQIRAEHHAQMMLRAKERGVTLPDEPPPRGMGRGMGPGGGGPGRY